MSAKTESRLTPGQRLSRGLKYSAVGPVDVTWGALGLGVDGAQSSAAWVGDRYRRSRLKDQLGKELAAAQETIAQELAAAQEVVSNLPQALLAALPSQAGGPSARSARGKARTRRRRRPLLLVALGVVALAGGAVAFSIIRRSTQPEPSTLPPSVEVSPKP
jgi:Cell wall synthesis protein CwsA